MTATTITGKVTDITRREISTLAGLALEIRLTVDTGDATETIGALIQADPVGADTDVEVGQTVTATGNRRHDGVITVRGRRDEADVLHYWTVEQAEADQDTARAAVEQHASTHADAYTDAVIDLDEAARIVAAREATLRRPATDEEIGHVFDSIAELA